MDLYRYDVLTGSDLTESDSVELSRLFSDSYGVWSAQSPYRPGERIRLPAARYRAWYGNADFRIARCRSAERLVGHAVYLDIRTSRGSVALVVQLVVDAAHRHRGIATALLHAAFGFSDYYAWAIVTSSPCTISALEDATFRRGDPVRIARDVPFLREELFAHIGFLRDVPPEVAPGMSRVNTAFYNDRSHLRDDPSRVAARYGVLPEGSEWLAVVFRDQEPDCLGRCTDVLAHSAAIVAEAYARMPQLTQKWASRTSAEIDRILRFVPDLAKTDAVCDCGAGSGRHLRALRERGFANVTGFDFAVSEDGRQAGVVQADGRTWCPAGSFRLILCLYDVVGSFADDAENRRLLKSLAAHLADDGRLVLSVANRRYGDRRPVRSVDSSDTANLIREVARLAPSNAMATDGEFFAHEALCDEAKGLFFHKEQFREAACGLPAEYLVVDRRYRADEIDALVRSAGLDACERHFVRAGFDRDCSETEGKEILLVCRRDRTL